ncbi:MAG: ribonuclease HII [Armatimonadota bacterium]|nr:ribonuclease HII [Armatimonadota bacterium]
MGLDLSDLSVREIEESLRQLPEISETLLARLSRDPRASVRFIAERWRKRLEQQRKERDRLHALFHLEQLKRQEGYRWIAGVDEAGRGPLAGPVVASAVILPERCEIPGLNDSKKLSPRAREKVYEAIMATAVAVGVGMAEVEEIEQYGIMEATRLAWRRAVAQLSPPPDLVILDGRVSLNLPMPVLTVVDADALVACAAAASVVSKVTRDRLMEELHQRFPQYGFASHKGYGTKEHLQALERFGPSPVHRRSFLRALPFLPSPLAGEGGG